MAHASVAMFGLVPGYITPDPTLASFDQLTNEWKYNHFGFNADTQFYFSLSIGYFLWDVLVCAWYRWGLEFLLHGLFCFVVYFFCLLPFQHYWGRFYLGVYEISTLPLHIRGIIKNVNGPEGLFKFVERSWVVSFTICRIIMGSYTTYFWTKEILTLLRTNTCRSPYLCYLFMFINFSMLGLMFYWWVLIIKGLLGRGRQNDRQDKEQFYQKKAEGNAAKNQQKEDSAKNSEAKDK